MKVNSYKDLIVWQKAIQLVEEVYLASRKFPKEETFGLTSQLRRAVVSIPSNIAEGQARQGTSEFRHFLSIARGSLAEVETQLIIATKLGYLTEETLAPVMILHTEIGKMLHSLIQKLT